MSHYLLMMSGQGCPADTVRYFNIYVMKLSGIETSICIHNYCLISSNKSFFAIPGFYNI